MSDLSVFVDESGTQEGAAEYYIVTYVLHDQSDDIERRVSLYEASLAPRHPVPRDAAHAGA